MYRLLFNKNIIKTLLLCVLMIIFSSLIISLNYNNGVSNQAYQAYLDLPFYFKLLFIIFIPIFNDFSYLFNYIILYFTPIIIIYAIYLAKTKINTKLLLPIAKNKQLIYNYLALYLHVFILITITFLCTTICSVICYKTFYLSNVISYLLFIILTLTIFNIYYFNVNKYSKILIFFSISYLIIMFVLNIILNNQLYYFSPINILLESSNNFLVIICPLLISIILNLSITIFKPNLN